MSLLQCTPAVTDAKKKDSDDFDEVTAKKEALSKATMKIGQAIYSQQMAEGGEGSEEEKKDDITIDADFTEKERWR